jgi:hypothetical protein
MIFALISGALAAFTAMIFVSTAIHGFDDSSFGLAVMTTLFGWGFWLCLARFRMTDHPIGKSTRAP